MSNAEAKFINWKKIQAALAKPLTWQQNGPLFFTKIGGLPITAYPTDRVGDGFTFEVWDGTKDAKGSEGACVMLYGYDKDALARAVYGAHVMGGHAYKETSKGVRVVRNAWKELQDSKHRAYHASLGIPGGPRVEVQADSMQRATYLIEIFEKAVQSEFKEPAKDWEPAIKKFSEAAWSRNGWKLLWTYDNEGFHGDFGQVKDDVPLLRARLYRDGVDGDEVDSYCTLTPIDTPRKKLQEMTRDLLNRLPTDGTYNKFVMQAWTHRTDPADG